MKSINLALMQDPQLRESFRSAQTTEQKIQLLKQAGYSQSDVKQAADRTSDCAYNVFQGKPPCE